jgi:CubicO group peptidase (beta-lactamase class C family)
MLRHICRLICAALIGLAPVARAAELTAQDLEAWADGYVPLALQRADIAGASLVVVKDGQVLLAKGYGVADVKTGARVDPYQTLFRPGSASKLFTWTAVMQLVEQGKLDLDTDINTYLDFKIPATYAKPITLRCLMTHTGGFEERIRDFFVRDPAKILPLGEALRVGMPARVYPPGEVVSYSNYGAGLAGYIVQRVSGEPFDRYVEAHIFKPLGMTSTSMSQPLPPALMARMSKGYAQASSGQEQWYEYVQWPSAGAAAMTATDMGRFMIAQLQDGRFGDVAILRPETARLMHGHLNSAGERAGINGFAHGFYEDSRPGLRVIVHGGGTMAFKTDLRLIPSKNVGLFLTLNGPGREGENYPLLQGFGDDFIARYFPLPTRRIAATKTALAHGREVAGNYISSRSTQSHWFKLARLFGQSVASVDDQGVLTVTGVTDAASLPTRWREIGPYIWQEIGGWRRLSVEHAADGSIKYIDGDFDQTSVLAPASGSENAATVMPVLIASLLVLALATLSWPVSAVVRRRFGARLEPAHRRGALVVRLTSLLHVLFFAGWFWVFANFVALMPSLDRSLDPKFRALQLVGLIAAIGTVLVVIHAARLWSCKDRGLWIKMGTTAVALAAIALTWIDVVFRLLWPALG